jgi:hypothetical protein
MTHKRNCAGHRQESSHCRFRIICRVDDPLPCGENSGGAEPPSRYSKSGWVTKQHHRQCRCLVTRPIGPKSANARLCVNKLLFRAMTSPPPTAIVDGMAYHATAMARSMCVSKGSPGASQLFQKRGKTHEKLYRLQTRRPPEVSVQGGLT